MLYLRLISEGNIQYDHAHYMYNYLKFVSNLQKYFNLRCPIVTM